MIRRLIAFSAVITLLSNWGPSAHAQGFGNSGSRSGGMGSSSFGSSSFGSGGFGSGGFGSGGFGSSGSGSGGFGNSGFGSGGFGNSGSGSGGFGNSGFGNSGFGNSGVGGGQSFIGRDAGDMQATFGQMNQMNRAVAQFFNNMNRGMNRSNSSRRSNNQTTQQTGQAIRVAVKVGFTPPRPTSDQMASTIRTRLAKILAGSQMSPATVSMEGDTAVVSGVASSENERDVISQLLAIEPGIRNVRNEMTIGSPSATTDTAPPAGS